MTLPRPLLAGFALIAFGGVLAAASIALPDDEPALFGMFAAGVGLLVVLVGLLPTRPPTA